MLIVDVQSVLKEAWDYKWLHSTYISSSGYFALYSMILIQKLKLPIYGPTHLLTRTSVQTD